MIDPMNLRQLAVPQSLAVRVLCRKNFGKLCSQHCFGVFSLPCSHGTYSSGFSSSVEFLEKGKYPDGIDSTAPRRFFEGVSEPQNP